MGTQALATIMDLFVEGTVASVEAPDGRLLPTWVNKLNTFEKEDCDRLGRGARAKRILAWDADEEEQAIFEYETGGYSDDELADALKAQVAAKHYYEAVQEIRTLPEWADRLEYLANAEILEVTSPESSDEDKAMFEQITTEYMTAVGTIQDRLQREFREDLLAKGREQMKKDYKAAWRDAEGMRAYYAERRVAEIFFATRECKAKVGDTGEWDHARCNHEVRLMANRGQVKALPDKLRMAIIAAIEALDITPDEAGNSDAPMASSEPSEPQSVVEESTASTPAATSDEPDGI